MEDIRMKIKSSLLVFVLLISTFPAKVIFAKPLMIDIAIDATGSVSEEDFEKAKIAVSLIAEVLEEKASVHEGEYADWISINFFGTVKDKNGKKYDEWIGTPFINCPDYETMYKVRCWTVIQEHPKFGYTSIYSAIRTSLLELIELDEMIGEYRQGISEDAYEKIIIVVTDGTDNSSKEEYIRKVQATFPHEYVGLVVIGVGPKGNASSFENDADAVFQIDNYDMLYITLIAIISS